MTFEEWLESADPVCKHEWETRLDEIISHGYIVDHTGIEMCMKIAYLAGQKSVKGKK